MNKHAHLDLTEGPIFKNLLLFACPLLFGRIMNLLYSIADSVMMGQLAGTLGLAAINAGHAPYSWICDAFHTTAVGVNVICGTLRGAKDTSGLRTCMHCCVSMGFLLGVLFLIISAIAGIPLLYLTKVPKEIFTDSATYYYTLVISGPFVLCESYCRNILFAHGNTRFPTIVGLGGGLLNVLLNALLIPFFGAFGAALATIISQFTSCVIFLVVLLRPKGPYHLNLKRMKLQWQYVKQILSIGIPASMNSIIFSLSNAPLQTALNIFGPTVVAGKSAANTLGGYIGLIQNSFADSALNATAQCYGAKKYQRISKIAAIASFGSSGVILCMSALLTLLARPLLGLINPDPAAIEAGIPYLLFFSWGSVIYTVTVSLGACLRGIKKASQATAVTTISVIIPRLLWVWLLVPYLETPFWLYAIYPISWLISAICVAITFLHYRKKLS